MKAMDPSVAYSKVILQRQVAVEISNIHLKAHTGTNMNASSTNILRHIHTCVHAVAYVLYAELVSYSLSAFVL